IKNCRWNTKTWFWTMTVQSIFWEGFLIQPIGIWKKKTYLTIILCFLKAMQFQVARKFFLLKVTKLYVRSNWSLKVKDYLLLGFTQRTQLKDFLNYLERQLDMTAPEG